MPQSVCRGLIRSIQLEESRFGFEPEVTSKVAAKNVTIKEVSTGYQSRGYDAGKKISWRDGIAAFWCMWRYRNPGWPRRLIAGLGRVAQRRFGIKS